MFGFDPISDSMNWANKVAEIIYQRAPLMSKGELHQVISLLKQVDAIVDRRKDDRREAEAK